MFRSEKRLPTGVSEKIVKRVQMLPSSDLVDWADQAIYSTGRCLTAYQRDRSKDMLAEAHVGAEVILAIVEEIQRRDAQ
jgi:hypothetical protein